MNKSKVGLIISYIIMAVCVVWLFVSGAIALGKSGAASPETAKSGQLCEVNADFATEALEVSNSVNFIPTGKEHYYLMVNGDDAVPLMVRVKSSWIKKNFTEGGDVIGSPIKIKGVVTRLDYKITKEVRDMNTKLQTLGITLDTSMYIDARYKEFAGLRMLCGGGFIVLGVLLFLGNRSGFIASKGGKIILAIPAVALAILMIYTLSVGG